MGNPLAIVVGGGIAGCTVAYELALRGAQVTLLERERIGVAASGRNTGTLLQQAEPEVRELMQRSLTIYQDLEEDVSLREIGQLVVAGNETDAARSKVRVEAIQAAGIAVTSLTRAQLASEFALLGDRVHAAYLVDGAWMLDPLRATTAFSRRSSDLGVDVRQGQEVVGIVKERGRVRGVLTATERLSGDLVVLASGPWLTDLAPAVPISCGRGWLLRQPGLDVAVPWVIEETSWPDQADLGRLTRPPTAGEVAEGTYSRPVAEAFVVAPQSDGGNLLGASLAPSLLGAPEDVDVPSRIARRALMFAPAMSGAPISGAWFAHRPMSPDGLPIAGMLEEGLYVHGGHGSLGMQSAPASARWLARQILEPGSSDSLDWLYCDRVIAPGEDARARWISPR